MVVFERQSRLLTGPANRRMGMGFEETEDENAAYHRSVAAWFVVSGTNEGARSRLRLACGR
jgi:hypothetical protein